jgi:hypothetical protein
VVTDILDQERPDKERVIVGLDRRPI